MPDTQDSDFSWREFLRRNNDELVATYGNLVHRVLTFTYRHFQGRIPQGSTPNELDRALLAKADETLEAVSRLIGLCRFREAIRVAMALAQEANRYLEESSPWRSISSDRQAAASTLVTALTAISCLKTVLYPFLPFSSQKLHQLLGYSGKVEDWGWRYETPPAGQPLLEPEPLFTKLDYSLVEMETAALGRATT